MKTELESKLEELRYLRSQYESDKLKALEDLKSVHAQQIKQLESSQGVSSEELVAQRKTLESEFQIKIDEMTQSLKDSNEEKLKLTTDYDAKLAKAQAFYDNELQAIKEAGAASDNDQIAALKEAAEKMKKDHIFEVSGLFITTLFSHS